LLGSLIPEMAGQSAQAGTYHKRCDWPGADSRRLDFLLGGLGPTWPRAAQLLPLLTLKWGGERLKFPSSFLGCGTNCDRPRRAVLAVPKAELGDLRRQIVFEEYMGKGLRNATGHHALKRCYRDSMRPRNLARSAERLPAHLDGSTLTTNEGATGDLRR
jgi:hypothetical protein